MSLRVWLPLTKDLSNNGLSEYDIGMFRGTETYNANGKLGKCFYANGVNTIKVYKIIPDFYKYTGYSLCAWFYIEARNTVHSGSGIISAGNWNNQVLNLAVSDWSTDHYTKLRVSGTSWGYTYNYNFNLNTWYHVVVSSDGVKTYAYVNGTLIGDTVTGFLPSSIEGNDICIGGATYYNGMQFFGRINDVRIYDHALSPKEVSEIAKGLVTHYTLGDKPCDNLLKYSRVTSKNQALLGSTVSGAWTSKLTIVNKDGYDSYYYPTDQSSTWFASGFWYNASLEANTTYTYSAWVYFTASASFNFTSLGHFQVYNASSTASDKSHEDIASARIYEPSTIQANTWTKIRLTFTTNSLANSSFQIYPRYAINANVGDLYFRDCKLEKGDKPTYWIPNYADIEYPLMGYDSTIIYDSSGYNYHGTKSGDITNNSDTPRYSASTQFVDNTSTVTITPCFSVGQTMAELSASTWFKTNTLNSTAPNLWSLGENAFARIRLANATSLWYYIRVGSTQVSATFAAGKTLTDDTWHHVVLTFKNGVVTVYLDSIQIGTTDHSATATYLTCNSAGTTWHLGGYTATAEKLRGSLSDFRLYTTCLSADAVKQLYNTPVSIANNGSMLTQGEFVEL